MRRSTAHGGPAAPPTVAIFPWGDVIEDFLGPIGLDAQAFADEMTGGWLFGYVAALQKAGWRPVIVCASRAVSAQVRLVHRGTGAPIHLVPGRSAGAGTGGGSPSLLSLRRWAATPLRAFRQTLREEGCLVILAQEYEDPRFDQLVLLGQALAIPVLATFQGGDRTWSGLEGLLRGRSIRRSAALIVASRAERERVAARYRGRLPPVVDIPNPIDCEEWQPMERDEARRRLGIDRQAFVALTHGRIDIQRKGLDVLLQAWTACGDGQLVLIGSGQDDAAFATLLAASGLGSVRWLAGYQSDRTLLRTWLSAADIYVTASRIEGMPVAPLEAMACGLPVVASDAQGLPDILAGGEASGGLVVARNDPSALAFAVNWLRTDPDLRTRMGRSARQRVETCFSVEVVSEALGDLLSRFRPKHPPGS